MVSVIIPLFNVERYIIDCLESLENQKYKDFELIIVNDGSEDKSTSVVRNYITRSKMNIILIDQENSGVSSARNRGIDKASGDYICFVDADDMVGPEYLSQMMDSFIKNNCDLVVCSSVSVPEDWNIRFYTPKYYPYRLIKSFEALEKFLYHVIVSGVCFIMVKREIIENNKLRFAEGYRYSEDIELMWKILSHSDTVAYSRSQLYIYRTRKSSAMSLVDEKRIDGFKLMKELEGYFKTVRPDFYEKYEKYGTARWVWATLWQIALSSNNYQKFMENSSRYNSKEYMRKLITYPQIYVAASSIVYLISHKLYYSIIRKVKDAQKREFFS
ncbi:glycosyltransferase family 2 protein [Paenibacillus sp. RC67]|uniref:glycosyltransferase family 2 protein n=1 Tax=Paenibacillus sp. RC67 TaxID=3039392 RepID=UPI0024AD16C6|nr:glycosyltransferase family 2 protein [Paenibacillus sp. RC67]